MSDFVKNWIQSLKNLTNHSVYAYPRFPRLDTDFWIRHRPRSVSVAFPQHLLLLRNIPGCPRIGYALAWCMHHTLCCVYATCCVCATTTRWTTAGWTTERWTGWGGGGAGPDDPPVYCYVSPTNNFYFFLNTLHFLQRLT